MQIKRYKNEFNYSYTLGIFPTIEVIKNKPDIVNKVFLSPDIEKSKGYEMIYSLCKENNIEVITDSAPFKILSTKENVYAIAVFNKYKSAISDGKNTVVLENPGNAGNVGTIIRTMVGMGVHNLVIIRPSVDLFNPEVIRSSMGSLFKINFEYFDTLDSYLKITKNSIYYLSGGGKSIAEVKIEKPYSLIFGNEGSGLSSDVAKHGEVLTIKMTDEIDSFNLSVAVGIALFHTQN